MSLRQRVRTVQPHVRTVQPRVRPVVIGASLAAALACLVPSASAIDSGDGSTPPPPPLTLAPPTPTGSSGVADPFAEAMTAGRAAIDALQWPAAITAFTKATSLQPKSADAFNLLAYSQRKAGRLDDAFTNYRKALAIDPKHRGAHEYLGEAYLQAKNVTAAKKELATLKKLCGTTCEEYRDLAADITAYERAARTKAKK